MNNPAIKIIALLKLLLIVAWPLTTYAATLSFGSRLTAIPPLAIAMTFVLSTLAGLTSLLQDMKAEYESKGKVDRMWLYVTSKMLGSNVAGLLAFFMAENYVMSEGTEAATIIVSAFGGTWLLKKVMESYVSKLVPGINLNKPKD